MNYKCFVKNGINVLEEYFFRKSFFKNQCNTYNLSSDKVKKAKRLGFTADEFVIYDLEHNNPNDYISEFERLRFRNAVANYRILLDNKIVFYNIIKNFADTNKIYAYKEKKQYISLEHNFEKSEILIRLQELGKIVYKKMNAGGGEGFKLLEYYNNNYFINHKKSSENDIKAILNKDNYLLEEYCVQSEFENTIWPYSVNTIRIITLLNDENIVIPVAAFQRVGIDKSKCVDNACAGGMHSKINISTGELTFARSHAADKLFDKEGNKLLFNKHPKTGTVIKGMKIPNWETVLKQVVDLHKKLLFTGIFFIAWDIALTNHGIKIIEANTSCSMDLLQTFEGMRNNYIGKWMKNNGYIK